MAALIAFFGAAACAGWGWFLRGIWEKEDRCLAMQDIHICMLPDSHRGHHHCAAAECGHHHWKDSKCALRGDA